MKAQPSAHDPMSILKRKFENGQLAKARSLQNVPVNVGVRYDKDGELEIAVFHRGDLGSRFRTALGPYCEGVPVRIIEVGGP